VNNISHLCASKQESVFIIPWQARGREGYKKTDLCAVGQKVSDKSVNELSDQLSEALYIPLIRHFRQ